MTYHANALASRALPQLSGQPFVTDGGIETCLIFQDGIDLPEFAAFVLLGSEAGRDALRRYYRRYLAIAAQRRAGFILESPTWRASADWGVKLGYSAGDLDRVNLAAIDLMAELRREFAGDGPVVISGCIGPRGDGYRPETVMSPAAAEAYHAAQVATFAKSDADMVTAITMTHAGEAAGIARAARAAGIPAAISFTLETDGRLPTGQSLADAIVEVDAESDEHPAYYMINCAHPDHFAGVLAESGAPLRRIRGIRANASRMSHAELDQAAELDDGDPAELGRDYARLRELLPEVNVVGGCCGTDHRHVGEMAKIF